MASGDQCRDAQSDPGAGVVLDALVVGCGFSGLCMAIKLREAGRSFVVLEQAASLGGTWRDNHYPGAACDVPSNLYCFSFAPKPDWSRSYPQQAELEAYMNDCADRYGVRGQLLFDRRVDSARFDAGSLSWCVSVRQGAETYRARSLILATGGLSRPQLPAIEGYGSFAGTSFHTARWDHAVSLAGKRVAVIGTGASAIQVVPELAKIVARLDVYQRTPPWVIFKADFAISARRQQARHRQPWRQRLNRAFTYAWHEAWAIGFTRWPWLLRSVQPLAQFYRHWQVPDRALRRKLKPAYVMGCKRVLLSNDYYPALMRENVALLTDPILRITREGIVSTDGSERAYDAIIACTGFQAAEAGAPFPVVGLQGRELDRVWSGGAHAYLGTTVSGFPNLFLMTGPNTALGHSSMIYVIEAQARYVLEAVAHLDQRPTQALDVREASLRDHNRWLQAKLAGTVWNTGGCSNWYRTRSGLNTTLWPEFTFVFRYRLRHFDEENYHWLSADSVGDPELQV